MTAPSSPTIPPRALLFCFLALPTCLVVPQAGAQTPATVTPEAPTTLPAAGPTSQMVSPTPTPGTTTPKSGTSELPFENLQVNRALLSRLSADVLRFAGGVLVAEGLNGNAVRVTSGDSSIKTKRLTIDLEKHGILAQGDVAIERDVTVMRRDMTPSRDTKRFPERVRELLQADEFRYESGTQQGRADNAHLHLSSFDLSAGSLLINGRRLTATHILLRPGGLSDADRAVYGTPPFNLRASRVMIDATNPHRMHTAVVGAGLYYKNTRILPVPSYVFGFGARTGRGGGGESFTLTPRISLNSADGFLVTTRIGIPVSSNPDRLALNADVGFSRNVGFRGGLALTHSNRLGNFELGLRRADIIGTQLTSRIELDRKPQLGYASPLTRLFRFAGNRRVSGCVVADIGKLTERLTDSNVPTVRSDRKHIAGFLTTRTEDTYGPYLDLFAGHSTYSDFPQNYDNKGFEVGFEGSLRRRIRGVVSYRHTTIDGATPFRFDLVEIARELRATVDYALSPRYLIPIDIRYDVQLHQTRDRSFGLLRSYKTFGYGITYDTARRDVRFEVRSGF